MSRFGKIAVAGLAFAAAAAVSSTAAFADTPFPATTAGPAATKNLGNLANAANTYATQAVAAASGALTISSGVVFSQAAGPCTGAGSFLLAFTLPSGVLFTSAPTATGDGIVYTGVSVSSGGNGSNSVTFSVNSTGAAGTGTVSLGSFTVSGASALQNPTTLVTSTNSGNFNISEQETGSAVSGCNEGTATAVALALSGSQVINATISNATVPVINVASPSLGMKFQQPNGTPAAGQVLADLGIDAIGTSTYLNATASAIYRLSATSATLTQNGNFQGIAAAYIAPAGPCQATASAEAAATGAIAGTISGNNTITYSSVNGYGGATPFTVGSYGTFPLYEVCFYASGTQLLASNAQSGTAPFPSQGIGSSVAVGTVSHGPAPVGTVGFPTASLGGLDGYNYNGEVQTILYGSNNTSYPSYFRFVNTGATPIPIYAFVQGDGGSTGTTTVENPLGANQSDLVPASKLISSSGITTGPAGRFAVTFFAPTVPTCVPGGNTAGLAPCVVGISQLMANPDGTVVMMGSGSAP